MAKKLFIMDGTQFAYRAYYAFINNPLKNASGMNTSAPFGMMSSILKILDTEQPDAFAVAFDKGKAEERIKIYPEYKSTRQKMPEELSESLPVIRKLVEAMNIPVIEREGIEADDLMATIAERAHERGWQVVLVTGDKDFMQLVRSGVSVLAPGRGAIPTEWWTAENASERFGIPPERIVDYLALTGDSSDNIPGVKGIGKVGAKKLIDEYGSLDQIYENIDKIGGATAKKLEESREDAFLSKRLATIDRDVDFDFDWESAPVGEPNYEKLAPILRELEFTSLLDRFFKEAGGDIAPKAETENAKYTLINSIEQLEKIVAKLKKIGRFAIDTETTDERPMSAKLVGISLCANAGEAFYIPIAHARAGEMFPSDDLNLPAETVIETLRPIVEDGKIAKVGQNIKYDLIVLENAGLGLRGISGDPMIADYLLAPGAYEHGIDALSMKHLGHRMMSFKELTADSCGGCSIAEISPERVANYACEDADFALRLADFLEPKLDEMELRSLYNEIEIPLIPVLADVEMTGIRIDTDFLKKLSAELKARLSEIEREIYKLAGEEFNIASPKQLSEVLFDKLELPPQKKTKTGYSTDSSVLQALAHRHDLPAKIISYRELAKLIGTYIDALPELVNSRTGRIHPTFQQAVASTGRLSCRDPNLQNIPVRGQTGREIRKAFIPAEGNLILSADYSQIELRVMAHISGDENLSRAFREGKDIHASTASQIFGVPETSVTSDQRRTAKVINFGVIYGMTAWGVGDRLDMDFSRAQNFVDAYFERFPAVKEYIDGAPKLAEEQGFVKTILGRRRYFPELKEGGRSKRFVQRAAINTPIQGSAADIIKLAMLKIHSALRKEKLETKIISTVHDELIFDVPNAEVDTVRELIREVMESVIELSVPLVVDVGVGKNWFEAHE
ncbi:MAG TPA: DNA polymerase I [candidate division Zixibacteria bacterium]|nr:DNA polymerase I [candidate division Zixibacteria bacterium]